MVTRELPKSPMLWEPDLSDSPIVLREYQTGLHKELQTAWEAEFAKVIMQLPTGGGKTEIAAKEVERRINSGWKNVTFLVHRDDLVVQTLRRFQSYGIPCVAGSGTVDNHWRARKPRPDGVVIVCIQTYINRIKNEPDCDVGSFLIVDEAHWYPDESRWGRVVDRHHGQVMGMTATPWRMSITEKFEPTWDFLVCGPTVPELIEMGYLADYILKDVTAHVKELANIKPIRFTRKADIGLNQDTVDHTATWERNKTTGVLTKHAVGIWYAEASEQQTIVFALTVDHAYALQDAFNALRGAPGLEEFSKESPMAECILGETPPSKRRDVLANFATQKTRVLITVDVLREGFDAPEASCLVVLRHTDSMAFWRQMIGRVLRPKADGKSALLLDMVGNFKSLGFPDDPYEWSLAPQTDDVIKGDAPYKTCKNVGGNPNCITINPIPRHHCKSCGASFGQVCPAKEDGCGEWRPWSRWTGEYSRYRPGCCDPCGEALFSLEIQKKRELEYLERQKRIERQRRIEQQQAYNARIQRELQAKIREGQEHAKMDQLEWEERMKPKPQWPWTNSNNGNGKIIHFALCDVWAGYRRHGSWNQEIWWTVFPNDLTPVKVKDQLEKVNRILQTERDRGGRINFPDISEAQLAVETLFKQFHPDNQKMLMGSLCSGCRQHWTEYDADGNPQKCRRCQISERVEVKYGTHGLDIDL